MKLFKILKNRSKTNVFFINCVEEEKRKNEASFFFGKKTKKNEYNRSSTIEDLPLLCWIFMSGAKYRQTGKKRLLLSTFISLWSPSFSFHSYSLQLLYLPLVSLNFSILLPAFICLWAFSFSFCLTANIYLSGPPCFVSLLLPAFICLWPPKLFYFIPGIYLSPVSLFSFCLTSSIYLSRVSLL